MLGPALRRLPALVVAPWLCKNCDCGKLQPRARPPHREKLTIKVLYGPLRHCRRVRETCVIASCGREGERESESGREKNTSHEVTVRATGLHGELVRDGRTHHYRRLIEDVGRLAVRDLRGGEAEKRGDERELHRTNF